MIMKNVNKKGFTLIELLAVIVILGVIMTIAIPAMSGYIANSRKDTMLSTAQEYISGAKTLLISENALPQSGEAVVIPVSTIEVDKGGVSPYTNQAFNETNGTSYILVYNTASTGAGTATSNYKYAIALEDGKGNCLDLVSEEFLTTASTRKKRAHIKGSSCTINAVMSSATTMSSFSIIDKDDTAQTVKAAGDTAFKVVYYK